MRPLGGFVGALNSGLPFQLPTRLSPPPTPAWWAAGRRTAYEYSCSCPRPTQPVQHLSWPVEHPDCFRDANRTCGLSWCPLVWIDSARPRRTSSDLAVHKISKRTPSFPRTTTRGGYLIEHQIQLDQNTTLITLLIAPVHGLTPLALNSGTPLGIGVRVGQNQAIENREVPFLNLIQLDSIGSKYKPALLVAFRGVPD